MEHKIKAITLSSVMKGEADKTVCLFSSELGVINATVKGARKQGSKLGMCAFTFAFTDLVLTEKNGFYTVIAVDMIEAFSNLSLDLDKFEVASGICETVQNYSRGNDNQSMLFMSVLQSFKMLSFTDISPKLIFTKFILETLKLSGYALDFKFGETVIQGQGEVHLDMFSGQLMIEKNQFCETLNNRMFSFLKAVDKVRLGDFESQINAGYDKTLENNCFCLMRSLAENIAGKKYKSFLM